MEYIETERDKLIREASELYGEIYRIRKSYFVPSHIGLGVWGTWQKPTGHMAERIAQQKQRSRLLGRARRLAKVGAA